MKILVFVLTLSVAGLATQQHAPISADEVTLRHRIYGDARVTIFLLDIPPGQATLLHRHDRDMLAVFVNGGRHAHHSTVPRPTQTRSRRAMFVSDPPASPIRRRTSAPTVPYGFQFKRSVMGVALNSASTLMRNRPSVPLSENAIAIGL